MTIQSYWTVPYIHPTENKLSPEGKVNPSTPLLLFFWIPLCSILWRNGDVHGHLQPLLQSSSKIVITAGTLSLQKKNNVKYIVVGTNRCRRASAYTVHSRNLPHLRFLTTTLSPGLRSWSRPWACSRPGARDRLPLLFLEGEMDFAQHRACRVPRHVGVSWPPLEHHKDRWPTHDGCRPTGRGALHRPQCALTAPHLEQKIISCCSSNSSSHKGAIHWQVAWDPKSAEAQFSCILHVIVNLLDCNSRMPITARSFHT